MTLHERILAEIDGANSQKPAIASVVRSKLGDITDHEFGAALDSLERTRRICTCDITRGTASWQVIWPTGVIVESGGWTSKSMSGITAPSGFIPNRLPQSPMQRRDREERLSDTRLLANRKPKKLKKEPDMASTQPTIDQRTDALVKALNAHPHEAISVIDIAKTLGIDSKTARVMMAPAVRRLVVAGDATELIKPNALGRSTQYLVSPKANEAKPSARQEPIPAGAKRGANDLNLCIYDDGRMLIETDDLCVELAPAETRKLVRFVVAMEGVATGGDTQ